MLRRNDDYDADFEASIADHGDQPLTERIRSAGVGDFPVDPLVLPPDAPVLPQRRTSAVVLTEAPSNLTTALTAPAELAPGLLGRERWRGVPCPAWQWAEAPGDPRWRYYGGRDRGSPSSSQPRRFRPDRGHSTFSLSALHGRAIPPDTRLTRQQRARLRRMLRAFDGHRAGATQQEIARVLRTPAGLSGTNGRRPRPVMPSRHSCATPVPWSPAVIGNSCVIAAHDNAILALMVGDFDTPNFALQLAALPAPPWSLPAADPQRPLATPRRPDHAT